MLCGDASCAVGLVCIMMLGVMGHPAGEDKTGEGPDHPDMHHVRQSQYLSAGEQDYILRRKQIVLESLINLGIGYTQHLAPHIAVLGSGGGQRAVVSLVGSLYQMKKEGLLDTILYLGGTSGSAMVMGSLYSDPQWSANIDAAVSRLSNSEVNITEVLAWLNERGKEEHFSLTDIWTAMTTFVITKEMDMRHLSEDAGNIMNPYPIYNAVDKNCLRNGPEESKWFEMTPYESGFTELGLFISTAHLGSRTHNVDIGESPEMDIVRLQGIMGSLLASEEVVVGYIFDWLKGLLGVEFTDEDLRNVVSFWTDVQQWQGITYQDCYFGGYHGVQYLMELVRKNIKDPSVLPFLHELEKTLIEQLQLNPFETKSTAQPIIAPWLQNVLAPLQNWTRSLYEGSNKNNTPLLIIKMLCLIVKWEWGTTENFLYQYPDASVPSCIRLEEHLQLIDAGVMMNIPFVPFLGEKRDMDLLIVLEYGAADTFTNLLESRDYATRLNKPFPEIDEKVLEEKDWPRDIYVFKGKAKEPTVVYMPLFNRKNCKDAEEIKAMGKKFTTFQPTYSNEKTDLLLKMAMNNIKNNKETLLRVIAEATLRRPFRTYNSDTF